MAISKNEPSVYVRSQLKVDASLIDNEPMVTNEELRSAFAERLNKAIKESGRPLRGAAVRMHELTGKSTNAAGKWLKGESMPTLVNMQLLCDWLGVRAEWLQYGIGPMKQTASTGEPRASYGPTTTQQHDLVMHDLVMHDTEIVEDDGPLRPDEVELPVFREVEFAAGSGQSQVVENHGHSMRFSLPRLARAGVQPHNAACATASGTSMEPTIADGSPIGIDKGARHVVDGKIYALDHGGLLRVKRLYRLPMGRVRLVSDNAEEYPEEVCSLMGEDAPKIIGRVFWWEVFD